MSRRASLLNRDNPNKVTKVRFPDDLVFLDDVKDNDIEGMSNMLRRASLKMDINAVMPSGMAPLHQAVLNGNIVAVTLLTNHGADVNKPDVDTWTPLHAACSEGYVEIVRLLLEHGADTNACTDHGERPIDLIDPNNIKLIALLLGNPDLSKRELSDAEDGPQNSDEEKTEALADVFTDDVV